MPKAPTEPKKIRSLQNLQAGAPRLLERYKQIEAEVYRALAIPKGLYLSIGDRLEGKTFRDLAEDKPMISGKEATMTST